MQSVTLNLPDAVIDRIRRAADISQRSFDEVLVEAVTAVAPVIDSESGSMRSALAQMAYLNDAALWQAARATLSNQQRERLAELHDEKNRRSLTLKEQTEADSLLELYRETILVRAHAAVLLKQRGYDISNPEQFIPLE